MIVMHVVNIANYCAYDYSNIKLFHADYDNLTEWKINTATKYVNLHLLEMHEKWPLLIN